MGSILPALGQTCFKRFDGRGQNEYAYGLRIPFAHLARALPINLEQYVLALLQGLVDAVARRTVIVAMDLRPFQQGILLAQRFEFFVADKTVVLVGFLAGARRACR